MAFDHVQIKIFGRTDKIVAEGHSEIVTVHFRRVNVFS